MQFMRSLNWLSADRHVAGQEFDHGLAEVVVPITGDHVQLIDFTKDPWQMIAPSAPYPLTVLRVNSDGNASDGIVLPEVNVPIATTPSPRRSGIMEPARKRIAGALQDWQKLLPKL
jgi:hypothetical protein